MRDGRQDCLKELIYLTSRGFSFASLTMLSAGLFQLHLHAVVLALMLGFVEPTLTLKSKVSISSKVTCLSSSTKSHLLKTKISPLPASGLLN